MSQLTLILLILLVAALWKFGPWFRRRRILSYDFPIGWWRHVARVDSQCSSWSPMMKAQAEDFIRLFVDQIEFTAAPSMQEELEIRHRVAFATVAFLLFRNLRSNPLSQIERFYVQRSYDENADPIGLPVLCWEDFDLNFSLMFEASSLSGKLNHNELIELSNYIRKGTTSNPELDQKLEHILN